MFRTLRHHVEQIMTGPETGQDSLLEQVLSGLSRGYCAAVRIRNRLYDRNVLPSRHPACRVISVGNITMGGTGKTPMTLFLAGYLKRSGYRVAVISRGYKGKAEHDGGIVSDGVNIRMTPEQAGDEPYMMAKRLKGIPVLVGKDRLENSRLAIETFATEVIILDDGFQHRRLSRDIDLVLLDSSRPLSNTRMFPRGILREPVASLSRADACIMTRSFPDLKVPDAVYKYLAGKPVFRTCHVPCTVKVIPGNRSTAESGRTSSIRGLRDLTGKTAMVFSGIARNEDFHRMVEHLGCRIVRFLEFADHHWYTPQDVERIRQVALSSEADLILTTEKDYVRIEPYAGWPLTLMAIGIEISFGDDTERFCRFIHQRLHQL